MRLVILAIVFGIDEKSSSSRSSRRHNLHNARRHARGHVGRDVADVDHLSRDLVLPRLGRRGPSDGVSLADAIQIVGATGRAETVDFNLDPNVTYTF